MADELEKTCENCEYENEDMEGTHCRHCIHNAEEHFELKACYIKEKEIRNNAIDEFAEALKELFKYESAWGETEYHKRFVIDISKIDEIAEEMKGSEENG